MYWYIFRSLKVKLGKPMPNLAREISKQISLPQSTLRKVNLAKKSLDARKRHQPFWLLQVEFALNSALKEPLPRGVSIAKHSVHEPSRPENLIPHSPKTNPTHVTVIGSGPAGLFTALALAEADQKVTLIERGKPVETRMKDIGILRGKGVLDPESNVCFGEGGAGTYTDGKLYTRVKDPSLAWVMARLVDFGAPHNILTDAHPHLGTDKLVRVLKALRAHLIDRGVEFIFQDRMVQLLVHKNQAHGVILNSGRQIESDYVVLGIGHSARETLEYLFGLGLEMEFKPFAVGVRAEHPQALINQAQYGPFADHPELGAAEYRLSYQFPDDAIGKRGVYSFCMCPGGFIVPTPTEPGKMALNGMSNANRSTPFANSGIVVQITADDLQRQGYKTHPLMGIQFQRELEEQTFQATETPYAAPAMRLTDFVESREPKDLAPTHFRPASVPYPLHQLMPNWIARPLQAAFKAFANQIKGYLTEEANLFAMETRTSSPVRIVRGKNMESVSLPRLLPVGEGAGYAGGIVSAALDGIRAAERIIQAPTR